jgi:DNA-binding HxlR family transcriptional regulator
MAKATTAATLEAPIDLDACRARDVLARVGDKWSVGVIYSLGSGTKRFTALLRGIEGISQRMLTVTLRGLERDGLVTRLVHPVVPPRVDYDLTPMGATLLSTVQSLVEWADRHTSDIEAARRDYDARQAGAREIA